MYTIENHTNAPIEFSLIERVEEACAADEKPRAYNRGGTVLDASQHKPSELNSWIVPWSDSRAKPSTVKVTDAQYAELIKQRGFSALLASGVLRAMKD